MMNLQLIIKKWYIILICALVGASGLYFEKSSVNPVVPKSGDLTYIRVVKFNNFPVIETNKDSIEVQMNALVGAWPNLAYLTEQVDILFDMSKINPYWNDLPKSQKFKWLVSHFRINRVSPGIYELIFQMKKTETKDIQYIEENSKQLMDTYESFFKKAASLAVNNTEITTIKEFSLIEEEDIPTVQDIKKSMLS